MHRAVVAGCGAMAHGWIKAIAETPALRDRIAIVGLNELRLAGWSGCIGIEGWHDPVYHNELEMTGQVHALRHLKSCRGGDFLNMTANYEGGDPSLTQSD